MDNKKVRVNITKSQYEYFLDVSQWFSYDYLADVLKTKEFSFQGPFKNKCDYFFLVNLF